ncbi:MAG: PIN domain-containing protein [Candidatus Omnitrophica bacterium]|nr:PIN domain-containing protein [Candidatus Omnitrophota bacterium]MCA9414683.1 PIN domain-containing protein [Candidatus Omnitrophota bacterium]MCB9767335.1 PIN domain-containing protein [Candidatus Omnitrophota bacterium]MCB9784671.1 PIN domain-containing protein [Candidatus Omnitrophota bacterium]
MRVVLDSNILVSMFDPKDRHHPVCEPLLEKIVLREIEVVCPVLVLAETVCAIQRRTGDSEFSTFILQNLTQLRAISWNDCTVASVRAACRLGIETGLKGADSIVVETAQSLKIPLVTQDLEIHSKCSDPVEVIEPSELVDQR